jgi:uncharacterized membrane protein YdbT with pleckstrin-like domain
MPKDYSKYYKKFSPTEDEEIVLVIKESLSAHFSKIIIALVLLLLPFFFMFYLISQGPIGVSIFAGLIILSAIYMIREFYIWSNTVFIITTQRIIDVEQNGLLHRTVSEIAHAKIQDISYQSKGLMQMIGGTGTIQVRTSVPDLKLAMFNVPNVKLHCSLINESVAEHHQRMGVEVNSQQKLENFEDFLDQDELEKYSEMNLKDLVEEYVSIYSRNRLKKTLYDQIHKDDEAGS